MTADLTPSDVFRATGLQTAEIRRLATGHGADLYLADLAGGGERVVLKQARQGGAALEIEGWMLKWLAERTAMPVPAVRFVSPALLAMDYVPDSGRFTETVERDAARHLAALHAVEGPRYGFDRDTLIGPFVQPNVMSDDWVSFFRDYRLMYMARHAFDEGRLPRQLLQQIERVAAGLGQWIDRPARPALIHGDVWSGNVLTGPQGVTAFIDPAIYYADPEMELAFIALFSTFGQAFFRAYAGHIPIRDGFFEVRKDIYALYPLLVHARLFGGAYLEKIGDIARALAG